MRISYNLKRSNYRSLYFLGVALALTISISNCQMEPAIDNFYADVQPSFDQYFQELGLDISNIEEVLIIPLDGCDNHINPILGSLDEFYPCGEITSSLIILDSDYSNILVQKTNLKKESLPPCIHFDPNTRAYYNKLVQFAPISYSIDEGQIKKIWNVADPEWGVYMNEHFLIHLVQVPSSN